MTDQVETKQVTWEDLEVREVPEVTEWEIGKEPIPTELARMGEMTILTNVSLEQCNEAMTKATKKLARMLEVYQYAGDGIFVAIGGIPLCTPHRDPLTDHIEE